MQGAISWFLTLCCSQAALCLIQPECSDSNRNNFQLWLVCKDKSNLSAVKSLSDHVLIGTFCPFLSPAVFPPPPFRSACPSFHFYLTSSNYFRVTTASRRAVRRDPGKLSRPPRPQTRCYPITAGDGTLCSQLHCSCHGVGQQQRVCVQSEGRGYDCQSTEKLEHFESQNKKSLCVLHGSNINVVFGSFLTTE